MMLSDSPPRPASRPRLIPGLSLHAGDVHAGQYRVTSLLRADRACAYLAATPSKKGSAPVEVQVLLVMDDGLDPVHLRFLDEARRASALQSPNVAVIREVGVTADGHPFLVREARTGESLRELLARVGSLPTESAVDVAIAVCEVLASAHAIGIVHGELSTSTVRLAWTDAGATQVKVVDLGISRALRMLPLDARNLESLSISAPELLQGSREPDHRSDAWGVGVLLYTMLAGAPPFAADSPSTVNLSVALDEPAMLAGVPDGLGDLVDACLARDPTHRPGTMQVLAAKLGPFGTQHVFAKRPSTLVDSTGKYQALVLEDLVERAADPHGRLTPVPSSDKTPEPSVVSQSVAPVAITVAPPAPAALSTAPAALAPLRPSLAATPRRSRTPVVAAAACIAIGVIIGIGTTRLSSEAPASAAAGIVAAPPPFAPELPLPRVETPLAVPQDPAPIAVGELHAAPTAPKPRAGAPRTVAAAPPVAAPAPPAEAVEPLVHSAAAAPNHPVPKASDDDLRRFLDDRR